MKHYVCQLRPPRPTFPNDITPDERELMRRHRDYWTDLLTQRKCICFGPVADPAGAYGLAVLELVDGEDPRALTQADPVVAAGRGFRYDVHPMLTAVARP